MTTFFLSTKLRTNGETQRTIASRAGVSQSLVSAVMRGRRNATPRVRAAIAEAARIDEATVVDLLPARRRP